MIYSFHSVNVPLFLISVYSKSQKADISDADRNDFKILAKGIVERYTKARP